MVYRFKDNHSRLPSPCQVFSQRFGFARIGMMPFGLSQFEHAKNEDAVPSGFGIGTMSRVMHILHFSAVWFIDFDHTTLFVKPQAS